MGRHKGRVMASEHGELLARLGVPQLCVPLVPPGEDARSVGTERRVSPDMVQLADELPAGNTPDTCCSVLVPNEHPLAVCAKHERPPGLALRVQGLELPSGVRVPESGLSVPERDEDPASIRAEGGIDQITWDLVWHLEQ